MRAFSTRRRRPGRQSQSFQPPDPAGTTTNEPSDLGREPSVGVPFTGIAPGWLIDPTGRHEKRYWSGSEWTEHVTDGGIPSSDPPPSGGGT